MNKQKKVPEQVVAVWWTSDVGYRFNEAPMSGDGNRMVRLTDATQGVLESLDEVAVEVVDNWLWLIVNVTEGVISPEEHLSISYNPMDVTALHRTFARTKCNRDGVCEFARQYGFLGRNTLSLNEFDEKTGERLAVRHWGEAFNEWVREIAQLRALLDIWDLYRDPNSAALDRLSSMFITEDSDYTVDDSYFAPILDESVSSVLDYWGNPMFEADDAPILATDSDDIPPVGDSGTRLRLIARKLLKETVNEQLRDGVYASIDVRDGAPIQLVPRDLLGAIYIHLARELLGESVPSKACAACGRYFVPEHGKQIYCDERCKFKAYRLRKKEESNV
jgi:hypothetical protein